jgi:hypothetical protein
MEEACTVQTGGKFTGQNRRGLPDTKMGEGALHKKRDLQKRRILHSKKRGNLDCTYMDGDRTEQN